MARQFQSRSRFGQVARRSTSWLTGPQLVSTSISGPANTIGTTGLQILEDGTTLVRTRGSVLLRLSTTAGGTTDGMSGAVGIAMGSENAFGAGFASLMHPFNDSEWDGWIFHSFYHLNGPATLGSAFQRIDIDSKAMRKIAALDVLYLAIATVEVGTEVIQMIADTRMLFKVS